MRQERRRATPHAPVHLLAALPRLLPEPLPRPPQLRQPGRGRRPAISRRRRRRLRRRPLSGLVQLGGELLVTRATGGGVLLGGHAGEPAGEPAGPARGSTLEPRWCLQ